MKKTVIIFVLLGVVSICIEIICIGILFLQNDDNIRFTNKIEDYQYSGLLPAEIPANADVISYSDIDFWHEARDVYLELKFQTKEELEQYLADLEIVFDTANISNGNSAIKTENIYDPSYTEIFDPQCATWKGNDRYTGYEIYTEDQVVYYDCNFSAVSYSFDDLTVVYTYVYGLFRSGYHDYIPRYFTRFSVPLVGEHQRIFSL